MSAYLSLQACIWLLMLVALFWDWINPNTRNADALLIGLTVFAFLQFAWPMYLLIRS